MTRNRAQSMRKIGLSSLLAGGIREIGAWPRRINGRKELAALSSRDLSDIGVIPWDVERETRKPFWQG